MSTLTDEQLRKVAEKCGAKRPVGDVSGRHYGRYLMQSGDVLARRSYDKWRLAPAGVAVCIETFEIEPQQDDEESARWRCYKRRRYGGTFYPYADTLVEAVTAALVEIVG